MRKPCFSFKTWAVVVYDHPKAPVNHTYELCHGHWLYCLLRRDIYMLLNYCHSSVLYPVLTEGQLRADGLLARGVRQ